MTGLKSNAIEVSQKDKSEFQVLFCSPLENKNAVVLYPELCPMYCSFLTHTYTQTYTLSYSDIYQT